MKIVLFARGLLFVGWCRFFDPALLNPTAEILPIRLPTLTPEVQSQRIVLSLDPQAVPTDVRVLFERETREVLTEPYGKPPGFLVRQTRRATVRAGLRYALVSGLTMGGLNLFGFPWAKYQYMVNVQLEVPTSSTNYAQPDRVLYLQCVRQGFNQLMPQLRTDVPWLQAALLQ